MTQYITDNIDGLVAAPLESGQGWTVSFRSGNAGMCHQLYVNGTLAQWTDGPDARSFVLEATEAPRQIAVIAVNSADRSVDLSDQFTPPPWVCRIRVARSLTHPAGSRVLVLGDHATGEMNPTPLAWADYWPEWMARQVPGFGLGAFGAEFGVDPDVLILAVPLAQEGTHRIVLRTVHPDGRWADSATREIAAAPPPAPANSVAAVSYDPQTSTITLNIQ